MQPDELELLYRKRFSPRSYGPSVARCSSVIGMRIKRVVAVIRRDGTQMDPRDYSTRPFKKQSHWSSHQIYWRVPTLTAGITVLFEAKP